MEDDARGIEGNIEEVLGFEEDLGDEIGDWG